MSKLEWRGAEVLARVRRETANAINDVTEDAAREARVAHWWKHRTFNLMRQTTNERAKRRGPLIIGRFGATYYGGQKGKRSGFYGYFLELREPWLRPAADATFPTLRERIRRRLQ